MESDGTWIEKFAAIDIGSNAVRLLIARPALPFGHKLIMKKRESLRLGGGVFSEGVIGKDTFAQAIEVFKGFRRTMNEHNVIRYRAVATSAVREAKNQSEFVSEVFRQSGLRIEVIDGKEEGQLVFLAVCRALDVKNRNGLIFDIGGGSVEFIFFSKGAVTDIDSLPLGTVRTLMSMPAEYRSPETKNDMQIRSHIEKFRPTLVAQLKKLGQPIDILIGTGGNLVSLGEVRSTVLEKKRSDIIRREELDKVIPKLIELGYQGRIKKLNLRADRADVIVPASFTVQMVMDQVGASEIRIPDVGLREGLCQAIAETMRTQK